MDNNAMELVAIVLGSNALVEFIKWVFERIDAHKDSPERMALRALCEDRLGKQPVQRL